MPELKRVRVLVSGDVQGVGFRWSTRGEAVGRGLSGWVRNRSDGRVEAVFEGPATDVDAMVAWCRVGPRWASVADVEAIPEEPTGEPGFQITP